MGITYGHRCPIYYNASYSELRALFCVSTVSIIFTIIYSNLNGIFEVLKLLSLISHTHTHFDLKNVLRRLCISKPNDHFFLFKAFSSASSLSLRARLSLSLHVYRAFPFSFPSLRYPYPYCLS